MGYERVWDWRDEIKLYILLCNKIWQISSQFSREVHKNHTMRLLHIGISNCIWHPRLKVQVYYAKFWSEYEQYAHKSATGPINGRVFPRNVWVLPSKDYGLWSMRKLWVMGLKSLQTNLVSQKSYGLRGIMGYEGYGLRGSWLYTGRVSHRLINKLRSNNLNVFLPYPGLGHSGSPMPSSLTLGKCEPVTNMPRHHLLDSGSDIWGAVSYPSMLSRSWVIDDAIDDVEAERKDETDFAWSTSRPLRTIYHFEKIGTKDTCESITRPSRKKHRGPWDCGIGAKKIPCPYSEISSPC